MLTRYLHKLKKIYKLDDREGINKDIEGLEEKLIRKLLNETVAFIENNLEISEKENFTRELDLATSSKDTENELRILVKYLEKIPNVKYKLDSWMNGMIANLEFQLIRNLS